MRNGSVLRPRPTSQNDRYRQGPVKEPIGIGILSIRVATRCRFDVMKKSALSHLENEAPQQLLGLGIKSLESQSKLYRELFI